MQSDLPLKRHARILLALDGRVLDRDMLAKLPRCCVQLSPRLDILLVNPPREPTSCLAMLLLRLEHSGVDYHLASSLGETGAEVLHYLSRHRGISAVLLVDPAHLDPESRRLIELKGHPVIFLSEC